MASEVTATEYGHPSRIPNRDANQRSVPDGEFLLRFLPVMSNLRDENLV